MRLFYFFARIVENKTCVEGCVAGDGNILQLLFRKIIAAYEDVFFEIGLLVGAKTGFQAREKMEELS